MDTQPAENPFNRFSLRPFDGIDHGTESGRNAADWLLSYTGFEAEQGDLPLSRQKQMVQLTERIGDVARAIRRHSETGPCAESIRHELGRAGSLVLRMMEHLERNTLGT